MVSWSDILCSIPDEHNDFLTIAVGIQWQEHPHCYLNISVQYIYAGDTQNDGEI